MQSSSTDGPPARWIAPSTPPPPRIARLAALTTASTSCSVMSPSTTVSSMTPSFPTGPRWTSRALEEPQHGPLEHRLPLVRGRRPAPCRGLDRDPLLVGVDPPRVDVRGPRERRGVPEELRDLLHRGDLRPLARGLRVARLV